MRHRLNSTNVVHDTIDGEALAIRSDTGTYYSMTGCSASAWSALLGGHDPAVAASAVATHHGADLATVAADLDTFALELTAESLLVCTADDSDEHDDSPPVLPAETSGQPWTTPSFEKFTDMADLLLFDPIHEVDTSGWPAVDKRTT